MARGAGVMLDTAYNINVQRNYIRRCIQYISKDNLSGMNMVNFM